MSKSPPRKVFLNLPVADLQRSIQFFTRLGFSFNPQFTDDSATCMILSEEAFVMLIVHARFKEFTPREICDTRSQCEGLFALSAQSREEVDALTAIALASGGSSAGDPVDMGWMYYTRFYDPDGHHWELAWMDPAGIQG